MLEGGTNRSRGNMLLWIVAAILAVAGLCVNAYEYNTGTESEIDWIVCISEVAILLAAGYFIIDTLRKKRKEKEEKE